jgi:hypothetical protein
VPGLDERFEAVILRAMAKEPDGRFRDCDEFLNALEQVVVRPGMQERSSTGRAFGSASSEVGPSAQARPAENRRQAGESASARREEEGRSDSEEAATINRSAGAALPGGLGPARSKAPLLFGILGVIALAVLLVARPWGARQSSGTSPDDTAVPQSCVLEVRLERPGFATLDGFFTPDHGQSARTVQVFSQLEPRTYQLDVWTSDGPRVRKPVAVGQGTTRVTASP